MEIKSPLFTEETVTDFDIVYMGGFKDQITLRKGDIVRHLPNGDVTITTIQPPELITVVRVNVLSYRTRERVIRWPVAKPVIGDAQSQNS